MSLRFHKRHSAITRLPFVGVFQGRCFAPYTESNVQRWFAPPLSGH